MASSFKNKQKIINIILAALILISFQSDQILKLANVYLSPESAAKIGFIVLIISTIVNQLATNKRVYTAEDLTIEKLSTILGKPLQEEIIQQTQATEEEDCYNFNIKNEKFPQEVEEFYDEIEYESILWLGGFVKTTLSAALIGSGASVLLSGLCNHPFLLQNPFYNSIVGLMSLIIGVIIVYLIDVERRNYKKKEIQVYQEKYNEDVEKLNEVYKKELLKQANVIAFQMVNESLHDMEDELEDNSY